MGQTYTIQLNGSLPEFLRVLDQCNREVERLTALLARPHCDASICDAADAAFKKQDLYARIVGNLILQRARDVGALGAEVGLETFANPLLEISQ